MSNKWRQRNLVKFLQRNFVVSLHWQYLILLVLLYLYIYHSWILSQVLTNFQERVPDEQNLWWIALHWLLGVCCVIWFHVRLHYFYRKTFGLNWKKFCELLIYICKAIENSGDSILRKWYFSRYVWLQLTWLFLLLVPLFRIGTKYLLDKLGFGFGILLDYRKW